MHADRSCGDGEAWVGRIGRRLARGHVVVGEQGGQPVEDHAGSAGDDGTQEFPDPLHLWGWLVQAAVLEHVDTRSKVLDDDLISGGHVDEECVVAVGDKEPGRVVRARIDGGAERLDGGRRRGVVGERKRELAS